MIIQIVLLFITTSIDLWNILFLIVTIIIEINFINSWVNYKSEKEKHNNALFFTLFISFYNIDFISLNIRKIQHNLA